METLIPAPVATSSAAGLALALADASRRRRSVTLDSRWIRPSSFTTLAVNVTHVIVDAADLVATVGAGVTLERLRLELANHEAFAAIDCPDENLTVGEVLGLGYDGPLSHSYGRLKDQVLGLTFVTGHGKAITAGGRVMKNVAGFDLPRLMIGAYGALGFITEVHLRLRRMVERDVTWIAQGTWERMTAMADRLASTSPSAGQNPAHDLSAAEIVRRKSGVTLAIRFRGSAPGADELDRHVEQFGFRRNSDAWLRLDEQVATASVVLRIGSTPSLARPVVAAVENRLGGDGVFRVNAVSGMLWAGECDAIAVKSLRQRLGELEVPITIQRAPPELLASVSIFGPALTTASVVSRLRNAFDPAGILATGERLYG
ncbi:MAG: FAD-binding oxidoreductase [Gemmatimonadales bacterium]